MKPQASTVVPELGPSPLLSGADNVQEISDDKPPIPVSEEVPFIRSFIQRVTRGVGGLSLGFGVNILEQLTVPVALYAWGKFRYGEWILLTGLVQILQLTGMGLQTFVVNKLCTCYARDDREGLERILHSALRVQLPLAIGTFAAVAVAMAIWPLDRILGLHTISGRRLFAVGLFLSAELLMGVPLGVIAGVYRATGYLARAAVIGAFQQFALVAMTLVLIWSRYSFSTVAGARVGVAVLVSLWMLHDLGRLHPWLETWPRLGTWREGLTFIGPGLFFLLIPLADYLSSQFTLAVTQKTLNGAEVSRLSTHRTIANFGQTVSALLTTAVWPELTALHALNRKNQISHVHQSLAKFNVWLVGAACFGILPFLPVLYPVWTDHKLMLDYWTLGFLLARLMLWGVWNASLTVLCATNQHYKLGFTLLGEGILTGAMSLFLVPSMGIRGAALAALLADICVSAWIIPGLALRETGDTPASFIVSITKAMAAIAIPVGIGLTGWELIPYPYLRWGLVFPVSAVLALGLMFLQLDASEHSGVVHLYRQIFKKAKPSSA